MRKNLILTGWYYPEYLAAAAAVYGHYKGKADVLGVSMAELAGVLDAKGGAYETIDILGVGLTENVERLARVLKDLAKKGIAVRWFSREKMPEETERVLSAAGAKFAAVKVKRTNDLVGVVADCFDGITEAEAKRLRLVATPTGIELKDYAKGDVPVAAVWQLLQKAAGFAHRDHGDGSACADVVKALAEKVSVVPKLPPRLRELMDACQAGYYSEFIGKSPATVETRKRLTMAAKYAGANVLILGETGTGKQVAAEYIHNNSEREGVFRHYNCAYGGSDDMLMDRLFGHEKGAFTDAKEQRKGLFDDADGGTLFLDEIGETSERVQAMLLTILETGTFVRVGGSEANRVKVDVRLVCATNRNLQQMVLEGKFRLDLYQRISEFPVQLTPLRDRKEDIEPLVRNFWHNMTGKMPTKKQIAALSAYDYPGNVRELIAILKQAKALGEDDFAKILAAHAEFNKVLLDGLRIQRGAFAAPITMHKTPSTYYPDNLDAAIRQHAKSVFDKFNQNLTATKDALGVSVNTLKKYLAESVSL